MQTLTKSGRRIVVLISLILMPVAAVNGQSSQDKGRIVARVDGTAITDSDLATQGYLAEDPPEVRQQIMQVAIDKELVYQAAKKIRFDQSPAFERLLDKYKAMQAQQRVTHLAIAYQRELQRIEATKEPADRPAEAIAQVVGAALAEAAAAIPITINDGAIPADILEPAIDAAFVTGQPRTLAVVDGHRIDPLWHALLTAAEIELPPADSDAAVEPIPTAIREALQTATLGIDDTAYELGHLYQIDAILRNPKRRLTPGPALIQILRPLLIAAAATREGFDKDAAYLKTVEGLPSLTGEPSPDTVRAMLIHGYVEHQGIEDLGQYHKQLREKARVEILE